MQYFYINSDSTLPTLRIELTNDGKNLFHKSYNFNNEIQNAKVTFSMRDERGVLKISNAPCSIILSNVEGCDEVYVIEYKWKERDTKAKGTYTGLFTITFFNDLYEEENTHDGGKLIVPIQEELSIIIK